MGTAKFLMKEPVKNKDIYRRATFLKQVLLYTATTFAEQTLFQQRYFFKRGTFSHGDLILLLLLLYYY